MYGRIILHILLIIIQVNNCFCNFVDIAVEKRNMHSDIGFTNLFRSKRILNCILLNIVGANYLYDFIPTDMNIS